MRLLERGDGVDLRRRVGGRRERCWSNSCRFAKGAVSTLRHARHWREPPRRSGSVQSLALGLGLAVAIPVGIISAVRQYSKLDNTVTMGSFLGLAIPNFWLALLLQLWLSVQLGWLPTLSTAQATAPPEERWRYFVMPVFVLAIPNIAYFARFMRSAMLEVIHQDFVTVARAKGLDNRGVLYRHALRNALIPMVTVIGLQLPRILSGAVIIEQIFAWPGLGLLAYDAIGHRDYPVVLGVTMLAGRR